MARALGDHLRQFVAANRFAQRGLRAHVDGLDEVLHFKNAFLRIPYQPEHDGIDIHRDGVAGQRGFGRDVGHAHALIDIRAESFYDRHNVKQARPAQPDILAEP